MTTESKQLSASLEDYLETILHIVQARQVARAKDIAERMEVTSSSVTGALHALGDRGLINYAPYDVITLTETGLAAAKDVDSRHELLREFFVSVLSLDKAEADEAACKMEHAASGLIVRRLGYLAKFIGTLPDLSSQQWRQEFLQFCEQRAELSAHQADAQ